MLASHRPRKWIFGHWHTRFRRQIGDTEFRCLPELAWCRIPGTEEQKKIRARAAGRRLADIGGTMPDLPLISRRRPPRE